MQPLAFVTGATGLLGSNLVSALVDAGYRVRALVRSRDKARGQLDLARVELVEGDLLDVAGFAPALAGASIVFHTAAYFRDSLKGGRHWDALRRVNVDGTQALLEACYAAGVRRFVHTSSIAVVQGTVSGAPIDETMRRAEHGEPNDYYRSKILADRVVDAFLANHPDLFATFVLPGYMNGPGDAGPTAGGQFVLDHVHRKIPGVIDAEFAYVDARDVAAAMVAAATRGRRGERYLVAGRAAHMSEALALLEQITGVPAPRRTLPMPVVALVALLNEAWARLSGKPVLLSWMTYRTLRREARLVNFDSSRAQRELGVTFRPLRETLADAVRWFAARGMLSVPATPALPA